MTEGSSSDAPTSRRHPPEALRRALRRDQRPVRPLHPPLVRSLSVLLAASAAAAVLIGMAGLRPDRGIIEPQLMWFPALARALAGAVLILLALREGVPGSGAPGRLRHASMIGVPVLLVVLAEWVAIRIGGGPLRGPWTQATGALGCYPREILLAIPGLFVFAWLLARAYPLRPVFAATAGAAGVGLMADAVLHLVCPVAAFSHALLVHGGAVASLAGTAAVAGWLASRRRFAAD